MPCKEQLRTLKNELSLYRSCTASLEPKLSNKVNERLILTRGRTLVFRRQTDIGKSHTPYGGWSLRKNIDSVLSFCPGD
jgi:hypothetical protein